MRRLPLHHDPAGRYVRVPLDGVSPADLGPLAGAPVVSGDDGRVAILPYEEVESLGPEWDPIDLSVGGGAPLRPAEVPPGVTLFPHQIQGVDFLAWRSSACLADDMGLGKTCQAIVASTAVLAEGERALVVCPSGLVQNWLEEFDRWADDWSAALLTPANAGVPARYFVVSYDALKRPEYQEVAQRTKWGLVICDEAHRLKNPGSGRHLAVAGLHRDRVWLLTGTPMLNRPEDLFGMLRIARHPLGSDARVFSALYGQRDGSPVAAKALGRRLLGWAMRRTKDAVLDLPGKQRAEVWAPSTGIGYDGIGGYMRARKAVALAKVQTTLDHVRGLLDRGHRVIVFTGYLDAMDLLRSALTEDGIEVATISGSTRTTARQEASAGLKAGTVSVLVGQIQAAGEGLNMTGASQVVFNDLALVPAQHWQAEDRAHRIGQTEHVDCHYVVSRDPIDRAVWALLERKGRVVKGFDVSVEVEQLTQAEIEGAVVALQDLGLDLSGMIRSSA